MTDQGHSAVLVWMDEKPQVVVRMYEEKGFKVRHPRKGNRS